MAILNANTLQLYALNAETGTKLRFAHAQTVSIDITNSLIDVTTKDSNSWTERLSGQKSFSLSADGLKDDGTTTTRHNLPTLSGYAISGDEIFFDFGIDTDGDGAFETGDVVYSGSGFITSLSQSGGTDDAPTYSISIDGNGALTQVTTA